jgi:hypothetical protein
MNETEKAGWWQRRAWLAAAKVNLGWVLRWWLPWAVGSAAVFACGVLLAKRSGMETDNWWPWLIAAWVLSVPVVWYRVRGQAFGVRDGFVRLEGELRLNNALTTAADGLGKWPDPKKGADGLRWRFERILAPPFAAMLLLTVAWRMPTEYPEAAISTAAVEPVAWQQVDDALEQLERNEAVTEESLEDFREKLDGLREQPKEDWYSHASLEAGDELRDQLERDVREFAEALQLASEAVTEIGATSEQAAEISERDLQRLSAAMQDALQQLGANGLGLDPDLAKQLANLQNLDPNQLRNLSPDQLQQLRQALQSAASQCQGLGGQTVSTDGQGQCQGEGECDGNCGNGNGQCQGNAPGFGGISRGPGAAPLSFGQETERGSDRLEGVSNDDLSRASLADQVGQSTGAHQVDRTIRVGPSSSGGAASRGDGGQAVWRNNLTPAERAVLKDFFK